MGFLDGVDRSIYHGVLLDFVGVELPLGGRLFPTDGRPPQAALAPLRALGDGVEHARAQDVRRVTRRDFEDALRVIKPAADVTLLRKYDEWASTFGTRGA